LGVAGFATVPLSSPHVLHHRFLVSLSLTPRPSVFHSKRETSGVESGCGLPFRLDAAAEKS
jgi:hypothetical protein